MNKYELSYIAGYFDGDGCFYIGKNIIKDRTNPKFRQQIIITSTDKKFIDYLVTNFKGTVQTSKKSAATAFHKPVNYFSMRKKSGVDFTNQIIDYLVEKKQEAELFLEFAQSKERDDLIIKMNQTKELSNLVNKEMKHEFEPSKNSIKPNKQDFAYLAGFIDAECSLGIQKYRAQNKPNYLYKMILQCNNTKFPTIKWLLERFGGQIHFVERRSGNILHRDQLAWRLSSNSLANILNKILPFLKHKKPVCKELLEFQKTILPKYGQRKSEEFKSSYKSVLETREKIVHNIHILNKKGI